MRQVYKFISTILFDISLFSEFIHYFHLKSRFLAVPISFSLIADDLPSSFSMWG